MSPGLGFLILARLTPPSPGEEPAMEDDDLETLDEEEADAEDEDPDPEALGLRREYSQMELAPQEYRFWTMDSCSGIQWA